MIEPAVLLMPSSQSLRRAVGIGAGLSALAAPYVARLLAVPWHGFDWFTSYAPSIAAVCLACLVNGMHAVTLYGIAVSTRMPDIAIAGAILLSLAYSLVAHFGNDLSSSSTAALSLLFIPLDGCMIALFTWATIGVMVRRAGRGARMAILALSLAIAGLAGWKAKEFLLQDQCLDSGGRWSARAACER